MLWLVPLAGGLPGGHVPGGRFRGRGQRAAGIALLTLRARETVPAMARATEGGSGSHVRNCGSHASWPSLARPTARFAGLLHVFSRHQRVCHGLRYFWSPPGWASVRRVAKQMYLPPLGARVHPHW